MTRPTIDLKVSSKSSVPALAARISAAIEGGQTPCLWALGSYACGRAAQAMALASAKLAPKGYHVVFKMFVDATDSKNATGEQQKVIYGIKAHAVLTKTK